MDEGEHDTKRHGLTLEEASRYLGVSASTVRRIIERGEVPAARVGGPHKGRLVLLRHDLDDYLARQQQAFEESRNCDSEDTAPAETNIPNFTTTKVFMHEESLMEAQSQNQQSQCSDHPAPGNLAPQVSVRADRGDEEEESTALDFYAEMRVYAMDPVTGARAELGYEREGEWIPIRFYEGPSLFCWRDQLEYWLTDVNTLRSVDGPLSLEDSKQYVEETIQRCLPLINEILEGTRPVPDTPVDVWPVNGEIWTIQRGERIPPGITHVREHDAMGMGVIPWHRIR